MNPPRFAVSHPDHVLECEEALEPVLIAAVARARAAGWTSDVIWLAILSLVNNLELAEIANKRTDQAIADAKAGLATHH
tara:strand:+ start:545 stop:781 length:237 start_codon:yes stop_codon:yes gene_type:complete